MSNISPLIAAGSLFDGDTLAPLIMCLGFCAIPIVAILTKHQRAMAEIIHGKRREDVLRGELEGVKAEMAEMRSQLRALSLPRSTADDTEGLKRRLG